MNFGTVIFLIQFYWILRYSYCARHNLIDIKEDREQLYEIHNSFFKKNKLAIYELVCVIDGRDAIFKYNNIIKAWFLKL